VVPVSLIQHLEIFGLFALTVALTCLVLRSEPDPSKRSAQTAAGLQSARRQLAARHLKAEIHSSALRMRRELDRELNRMDEREEEIDG
jgi:hypothetical protein